MAARTRQLHIEVECDAALIDDDDAIGERHGLGNIMRDEHGGEFLLAPDALQQKLHFDAGERVERAERLIQRQDLRMGDKRPRQRNTLLLAAGKHIRPLTRPIPQAHLIEDGKRLFLRRLAPGDAGQPHGNVIRDTLPRQETRLLKHHAGAA